MGYIIDGGDAPTRLANIRLRLRRMVGHRTDTVLVSDDECNDAMAEALRAVNKHWPAYNIGSFLTVAAQQAYSPLPVGGKEIAEVFWSNAACSQGIAATWPSLVDPEFAAALGQVTEEGNRYGPEPAALVMLRRNRSYLERWFGRTNTLIDRATVYLHPTPSAAGTSVYFVYTTTRFAASSDVTDEVPELVDAYWAKALQTLHGILAVGDGAIDQVTGPDGVTVRMSSAARHAEARDKKEQEFTDQIGLATSWWNDA